jgi:hypothetical protein
MENNIRKAFRNNLKFNPFSDKFDLAEVIAGIKKYIDDFFENDPDAPKLTQTAIATSQLNRLYKDIYDVLKKRVLESNSAKHDLMLRQVASVNRHYMILSERRSKENQIETRFEDQFRQRIPSADSSVGSIDPGAALESEIDALNVSLNYIKYFDPPVDTADQREEVKYVETARAIAMFGVMYYVIKRCFDDITWNDGFMHYDKQSKVFKMTFTEPQHLILDKIGFYRLQRNGHGTYIQMLEKIDPNTMRFSIGGDKKRRQRIARVYTANGYILYGLEVGDDSDESNWELHTKSNLEAYYSFIEDVALPNLPGLTLNDLICLFCQVQHLFRKASQQYLTDDSVMSRVDFFKFPIRIKEQGLKNYLSSRTTFSSDQVNAFIELLTNKAGKRIDFWNYPFLKIDEDLVVPLISVNDPIIHYLIDRWLEDGGYSLDNRGKFFEDDIKQYMSRRLREHGFQYHIPATLKLFNNAGQFEEVDLLVNLKDIVLVGEVKCIKFPMEPRDHYNAYQRLENGSLQVNRKTDFIVRYAKELEPVIGNIENKQIVKLVITNYPNFTGYRMNGVAVIDYYMLQSYLSTGKVTGHKITFDNGKITNEVTSEIVLWSDEESFNKNIESHMYTPPAVEQVKPLIELTESKITLKGLALQILTQAAEFKPIPE